MIDVDPALQPFLADVWTAFRESCPGARLHIGMDFIPDLDMQPVWTLLITTPGGSAFTHEGIGSLLSTLEAAVQKAADTIEQRSVGNVVYLNARRS